MMMSYTSRKWRTIIKPYLKPAEVEQYTDLDATIDLATELQYNLGADIDWIGFCDDFLGRQQQLRVTHCTWRNGQLKTTTSFITDLSLPLNPNADSERI